MKRIYICVSRQLTDEKTMNLVKKVCRWSREHRMLPLADQYLFVDFGRGEDHVKDLDEAHERFLDREYKRALMRLCDEVWVFLTGDPDETVNRDIETAQELDLDIQIVRKGTALWPLR